MTLLCIDILNQIVQNARLVGVSACCFGMFILFTPTGILAQNVAGGESYGMRVRGIPQQPTAIAEPVWVAPAPGNESTLVSLKTGELRVFFINRPGDADKLMSIASSDGIHWSQPVKEFDLPGQAYYASRVLEDQQGVLHCVFHVWGTGENGYRGRHLDLWYCQKKSPESGWSAPKKIDDGYVGSIRSFIRLRTGRLLTTFAKAVPERMNKPADGQKDFGWNDLISLYSDDNGVSWKPSNAIQVEIDGAMTVRYGGVEPTVLERTDGQLWMLIRTNKGHLYESFSSDQGTTWQAPRPTRFIASDSPAELLRLSDNRILLFFNSNQRWDNPRTYAAGGRDVLHAALSRDEGKTWQGFREILTVSSVKPAQPETRDRGTAYASAVETRHGKVAVVSGQGDAKSIVLFDPNWLEQEQASDDFSNGLAQWTFFEADRLQSLIPVPATKQKALRLHPSGTGVWNFPATRQGELTAKLEIPTGGHSVALALTDHFSVSADARALDHAILQFTLKPEDLPQKGAKRNRIMAKIGWDAEKSEAVFSVDNRIVARTPFRRQPGFGINYLRIGLLNDPAPSADILIHAVAINPK